MKKEEAHEALEDIYTSFNSKQHFRAKVDWDTVKQLNGEEFLWAVLEPMSLMVDSYEHEAERVQRLSPAQKALYFFWYLDAQVANGGFIEFYWNAFDFYLPSIETGQELMQYDKLLPIIDKAHHLYLQHEDDFDKCKEQDDIEWLYENIKGFDRIDEQYYDLTEELHGFIERFVRKNIDEFIEK